MNDKTKIDTFSARTLVRLVGKKNKQAITIPEAALNNGITQYGDVTWN